MTSPREILTVAEMTAADKAGAQAAGSSFVLMQRAGEAVAREVTRRFGDGEVVVLAGPGNNGGDGYVAAQALRQAGRSVRVLAAGPPKTEDARMAAAAWDGETGSLTTSIPSGAVVIDALFGAGLDRPLAGDVAKLVRRLEPLSARIVAVDVPSGVAGDTGKILGDCAVKAALTVTFHRLKIAHVLQPARALCGEIVVADIGLPPTTSRLFENTPELWGSRFPWPAVNAYKTERGRLVVISGDAWSTGAARLASRAGLRIGAGLVTVLSPPDSLTANAAHLEAVMLRPFETEQELEQIASHVEAAVIGPAAGVTDSTLANVLALARTGAALVVDADALTVFRDDPSELFSALDRDDVLTPHPGEFERIFPGLLKRSPERITAARSAAARAEAVVLLKGADTVVAAPDGRAAVTMNGAPWLATAGSGDVLAGLIGGLLAQGMDSFEAACAGAWIHAEAGASHGPGLISEDLPGLVPSVLRALRGRQVAAPSC